MEVICRLSFAVFTFDGMQIVKKKGNFKLEFQQERKPLKYRRLPAFYFHFQL